MIIYKVTNLVNKKIYIGQSINSLDHRKKQHYKESKYHKNDTTYFHNALKKYSEQDFIWEILEEVSTLEELNSREIYWINYYQSTNKKIGYNLKLGGNNGGKCCESTKQKIGETTKAKWANPELAVRMREGLRKGTETVKQKALVNYKTVICKHCGKKFTYRPCDTHGIAPKFCSDICFQVYMKLASRKNSQLASKLIIERKEKERQLIKQRLFDWIPNFEKFKNTPMNKLTPLFNELMPLCEYKDPRTLMLVLGFTSKKAFFKELSKIYAELMGNYENQEIKSS